MKKLINKPEDVVEEMIDGMVLAYKNTYERIPNLHAIANKNRRKNKVSLLIGGGSGHEPLFFGFVGDGLADAAACGNIFASPNPQLIYETAKYVDEGKGVLMVYGNYAGDNMNFDMAEELCEFDDIKTAHVRVWDDVASAPEERIEDRRGIAGDYFVIKVAGGACEAGLSLEEVVRVTEKARDMTGSIGLATSPGTIPGEATASFTLGDDEIEFGMGLHGEPGIERTTMKPANELVARMYHELKTAMKLKGGEELAVLVNGLGSTTLLELGILYNDLHTLLEADNMVVYDAEIKDLCTCQEMGGFSISFMVLDDELKQYFKMPCNAPYFRRGELA